MILSFYSKCSEKYHKTNVNSLNNADGSDKNQFSNNSNVQYLSSEYKNVTEFNDTLSFQEGSNNFANLDRLKYKKIFKVNKSLLKNNWTLKEDKLLKHITQKLEPKNWSRISKFFDNKSAIQCSARYRRIFKGHKKGTWSNEEDALLVKFVKIHGKNWSILSKLMKNRSGKQIRERYLNKLDSTINHSKFTIEEDQKIFDLYKIYKNKWTSISQFFNHRTGDMIKNRFNSFLKKRSMFYNFQSEVAIDKATKSTMLLESINDNMQQIKFVDISHNVSNEDVKSENLIFDNIPKQENENISKAETHNDLNDATNARESEDLLHMQPTDNFFKYNPQNCGYQKSEDLPNNKKNIIKNTNDEDSFKFDNKNLMNNHFCDIQNILLKRNQQDYKNNIPNIFEKNFNLYSHSFNSKSDEIYALNLKNKMHNKYDKSMTNFNDFNMSNIISELFLKTMINEVYCRIKEIFRCNNNKLDY